jgi:hypothetical protein
MMKKTVNLFFALPAHQQKALKVWQKISLSLICCIFLIGLGTNCYQCITIFRHQKKKNYLTNQQAQRGVNNAEHVLKKNEALRTIREKIMRYQEPVSPIQELIEYISKIIPADIALSGFHFQRNSLISINGQARSIDALEHFIESLKKCEPCNSIKLESVAHVLDSQQKQLIEFRLLAALH